MERLLPDALVLPQGARGDYLLRQCGGNRALLDELESLLRAEAGPGRLLGSGVEGARAERPRMPHSQAFDPASIRLPGERGDSELDLGLGIRAITCNHVRGAPGGGGKVVQPNCLRIVSEGVL